MQALVDEALENRLGAYSEWKYGYHPFFEQQLDQTCMFTLAFV